MDTTRARSMALKLVPVLVLGLMDILGDHRAGRSTPFESFGRVAGVRNHQGWTSTQHLGVRFARTFAVIIVSLKESSSRYAEDSESCLID